MVRATIWAWRLGTYLANFPRTIVVPKANMLRPPQRLLHQLGQSNECVSVKKPLKKKKKKRKRALDGVVDLSSSAPMSIYMTDIYIDTYLFVNVHSTTKVISGRVLYI